MAGLIGNVMVSIYYGVILSYTLYYLFASFQYPLPWTNDLDGVNCTSPQHGTHYVRLCFYPDTIQK